MEEPLKTSTNPIFPELSAAEMKAVWYMRELKPYQRIDIKFKDNDPRQISVTRIETLREDFPVDR